MYHQIVQYGVRFRYYPNILDRWYDPTTLQGKDSSPSDDPDNYRGITLLSCVGKLFTAVVNQRLTLYFEGKGLIGDEQAGFRSGHSTLDNIYVLNSIVELYS